MVCDVVVVAHCGLARCRVCSATEALTRSSRAGYYRRFSPIAGTWARRERARTRWIGSGDARGASLLHERAPPGALWIMRRNLRSRGARAARAGAEVMLQTVLDGAAASGHEIELVFLAPGPWASELSAQGFHVEVIPVGRVREAHRMASSVLSLSRLLRRRRPDLIVNWIAKAQLYCAPAAVLAGMSDRLVWWQHDIPSGYWLDRLATALPALAVGCSSRASALAQSAQFPSRRTFVVAPGTRPPDPGELPDPLPLPAGVPVVGLVGRLQPWKGQDRLLQAHALLRERGSAHADRRRRRARALIGVRGVAGAAGQQAGPAGGGHDGATCPTPGRIWTAWTSWSTPRIPSRSGSCCWRRWRAAWPSSPSTRAAPPRSSRTASPAYSPAPASPALADALQPLLESKALRDELGRAGHERYLGEYTDEQMRRRFFSELEALRPGR